MSDGKNQQIPAAYLRSETRFAKAIYGKGFVADAFRRLCAKGCDPKHLQTNLLKLSRLPQGKLPKLYNAKDLLKLQAIAAKVKKAADELEPFEDLLMRESFGGRNFLREFLDWERPIQIPSTLRQVSDRLNQCSDWAKSSPYTYPNVYERIPVVVDYVRTTTGRPHYEEMATLIGAALLDPKFNLEQLKMICERRKSKAKK